MSKANRTKSSANTDNEGDGKIFGLPLRWGPQNISSSNATVEAQVASTSCSEEEEPTDSDLYLTLRDILNPTYDTFKTTALVWMFRKLGIETSDDLCVVEESMLLDHESAADSQASASASASASSYYGAFAQPTFRKKLLLIVQYLASGHELSEGLTIQEIIQSQGASRQQNSPTRPASERPVARKITQNDKAILQSTEWSSVSANQLFTKAGRTALSYTDFLKLEDKVSLADPKAVFLQGVVVYVGTVHFADGVHVGVQLTGPSIGCGNCDGTFQGTAYFANVGRRNGVLVPIEKITKREEVSEHVLAKGMSEEEMLQAKTMVDILTNQRAAAILNESEEQRKHRRVFFPMLGAGKEELYIQRLRETYLGKAIRTRPSRRSHDKSYRYSEPGSVLRSADLALAAGLDQSGQTFCLADPTLPGNPIVYASSSFLRMTGYHLNDVLGRNCRFLQGPQTDQANIDLVRKSIQEGVDCHVCLLNYRRDGSQFYNRLFMTALRDTKGRIKRFLGVQCEVTEAIAKRINSQEMAVFEAGLRRTGTRFTTVFTSTSAAGKDVSETSLTESSSIDRFFSSPSRDSPESERDSGSSKSRSNSNKLDNSQHNNSSGWTHLVPDEYDFTEALFRSTMEDPLAPMSLEEMKQFREIKSGSGYSYNSTVSKDDNEASTTGNQDVNGSSATTFVEI